MSGTTAVHDFFRYMKEGDLDRLLETVHEEAEFCAPGPHTVPIYNTFHGKEGVREFVRILGELFQNEVFDVYDIVGQGELAFAHGHMRHRVKATKRIFDCDWALVCTIKGGKIISYKMFEDTGGARKSLYAILGSKITLKIKKDP